MNAAPVTIPAALPRTIEEYLEQVRAALAGADPALIQDALYDAEEHLRSELDEHPDGDESALIARIASSYGSPEEVAAIYRETETRVTHALRAPPQPPRRSLAGRFFGVAADPRTYASLFYMLLSLATGIFYFTWAVTGVSLSLGLSILIIGLPFAALFLGTVRVLSLVEGRLVEAMLGVRMPRRPQYAQRAQPWLERIKAMFTDPRTWSTLLYFVLMLPVGILYFTIATVGLALSLSFIATPFAVIMIDGHNVTYDALFLPPALSIPLVFVLGVVLLFAMLHLARAIGQQHGKIAKALLVKG